MIIVSRGCNIIFRLFSPLYAASPLLGLGKVILIENRNIVDETEDSIIQFTIYKKEAGNFTKKIQATLKQLLEERWNLKFHSQAANPNRSAQRI